MLRRVRAEKELDLDWLRERMSIRVLKWCGFLIWKMSWWWCLQS